MRRHTIALSLFLSCIVSVSALADELRGDEAFSAGDYPAAYREWRESADAGDGSSMAAIGTLFDTGHGVPQDFATALQWYQRGAEAGDVRAMFNVAAMYDSGRGTPVNRAEALRWYRMAADRGNGRAAYNLGLIYRDGDGVARDPANAEHFFRLASARGIQAARENLSDMGVAKPPPALKPAQPFAAPIHPSKDINTADNRIKDIARFQEAALARSPTDESSVKAFIPLLPSLLHQAEVGNQLAQYDVAYAFERGIGTSADPVRSYVYYLRASAAGESKTKLAALQGASEVSKQLTAAQHAVARDMLIGGDR